MADGEFQVITGDVRDAARVFASQGADLDEQGAGAPHTSPQTGDGALDQTLSLTLETLGFLLQALGEQAKNHSAKLSAAADNYDRSEQAILARLAQLRL
jgi:Family of unknown function (DUF6317)